MDGRTHMVWSLAAGLALAHALALPLLFTISAAMIAMAGGIFPDLDHPRSFVGKYVKFLNYGVRHRGFLHSLWAIALIVCLQLSILGSPAWIFLPFIVGYFLHLVLDALTPAGIRFLYPLKVGHFHGFVRGDGIPGFAMFIAGIGCVALAIAAFVLF